jgi:hypothetical protein
VERKHWTQGVSAPVRSTLDTRLSAPESSNVRHGHQPRSVSTPFPAGANECVIVATTPLFPRAQRSRHAPTPSFPESASGLGPGHPCAGLPN